VVVRSAPSTHIFAAPLAAGATAVATKTLTLEGF
jgi:hypothetical protein